MTHSALRECPLVSTVHLKNELPVPGNVSAECINGKMSKSEQMSMTNKRTKKQI